MSGPTLWKFWVYPYAATDGTLIAAARLADEAHPETQKALANAADRSPEEANLLAARVLLWGGVQAVCDSHVEESMPYQWPLRVSPDLLGKHGPFLAWRGMEMSDHTRNGLMHTGWPCLRLGDPDSIARFDNREDEQSEDEGQYYNAIEAVANGDPIDYAAQAASGERLRAKRVARDAVNEAAHLEAAQWLLAKSYDPGMEEFAIPSTSLRTNIVRCAA